MYCSYFGFHERPFSIAPDPGFLYMSELHREALAHLLYGVKSDSGFVLLTGEVGTGKTTICRCLLEQMPESSKVAYVINPRMSALELLATICDEFGIKYPPASESIKLFVDLINEYLLEAHAAGLKPVLIIDEAQNLSYELLEQIRLLTNLETNERKLLLIVMLGQPELREKLLRPELRQLQQRITARYHLGPLGKRDTAAYIGHRLAVAGVRRKLFKKPALNRLFKLSGGVPRLINLLCDRALLGAYAQGDGKIDRQTVQKAASEIMDGGKRNNDGGNRFSTWGLAAVLASLIAWVVFTGNPANFVEHYRTIGTSLIKSSFHHILSRPPEVENHSAQPVKSFICLVSHQKDSKLVVLATVSQDGGSDAVAAPDQPLVWPAAQPRERNKIMAYESLFEQWGISYDETRGTACNQAVAAGLRCLYKQGNLGSLRRLNRPAVLRFLDDEGDEYFATLAGLRDKTARLLVGGQPEMVSIDELERHWTGTYTLLWRMPNGYQGAVLPGNSAPWLPWLSNHLIATTEAPLSIGVDEDDNILAGELLERVKAFQRDNGLPADGILGPWTIISLNSLAYQGDSDTNVPYLRAGKDVHLDRSLISQIQLSKN